MEDKLTTIKHWLGTGSINIFGLPMSGKDTQGIKLAEALNAKFLSSGMIIRAMEEQTKQHFTADGSLAPTDIFYEWVLPYFKRKDLQSYPLVLSSIGRWHGEEDQVLSAAANANHEIKVAIVLDISEVEVERRFEAAKTLDDRGDRHDDEELKIFQHRLQEFRTKTAPVIRYYQTLGLLIEVNGHQTREKVFNELVEKLYQKATAN